MNIINDEFLIEHDDWLEKYKPLNKEDRLCTNNKLARKLEYMADDILKKDKEKNKDITYKFYTNEIEFKSKSSQNISLDTLDFLISNEPVDYKKNRIEKKQIITKQDKTKPVLKDYANLMNVCTNIKMNKELKMDMLLAKDKLNGTIYFKHVTEGTTETDWHLFSFENREHVKALLLINGNVGSNNWLGALVYDLEKIMSGLLSEREMAILEMWKGGCTLEEIAKSYSITFQAVSQTIDLILNKICKQYIRQKQDWLELNILRGKYKKCKKCGENKLLNEFYKDINNKDGYKNSCQKCSKNK